jgi:hypothetical protein
MPSSLNPMDHPVCLATPAYLPSGGNSLTHLPFTMWLVDVLRPRVLVELERATGPCSARAAKRLRGAA